MLNAPACVRRMNRRSVNTPHVSETATAFRNASGAAVEALIAEKFYAPRRAAADAAEAKEVKRIDE